MNFAEAYDPIRALQSSWKLMVRAPVAILIGGALLTLTDNSGFEFIHDAVRDTLHKHHDADTNVVHALAPLLACCCCVSLAFFLFSSLMALGLAHAVEKTVSTGTAQLGDVFDANHRYFDMVFARVLALLVFLAACVPFGVLLFGAHIAQQVLHFDEGLAGAIFVLGSLAYLPVLVYVMLGISLFRQSVAIEGLTPTEALRRSWSLASGNRLRLLLYWIVLCVFTCVGFCLCCIGVLWTGGLAHTAANESYLALVKPDDYARSWLASGAVPPPPPPAPATIG